MSALTIVILIILSPIILIAGFISLTIILGIIYAIFSIPISLAKKQVIKCQEEDRKNTQK
ncbi:MAG: hypothetical protein UE116_06330 [Clostridia bacterium]|jgi:hypothetical protein|nr:hypothetical protein [Clostridia bacterium]